MAQQIKQLAQTCGWAQGLWESSVKPQATAGLQGRMFPGRLRKALLTGPLQAASPARSLAAMLSGARDSL